MKESLPPTRQSWLADRWILLLRLREEWGYTAAVVLVMVVQLQLVLFLVAMLLCQELRGLHYLLNTILAWCATTQQWGLWIALLALVFSFLPNVKERAPSSR